MRPPTCTFSLAPECQLILAWTLSAMPAPDCGKRSIRRIWPRLRRGNGIQNPCGRGICGALTSPAGLSHMPDTGRRSEEHTSELQSRFDLVCRLLLEKKKQKDETDCK